jgi:uncharacterized phage-associated protein
LAVGTKYACDNTEGGPMLNCFDIANYFLMRADMGGDTITPLKIQKLLYYGQGIHLATLNKAAFSNHIEAWTLGPVVPDAYHIYKVYGSDHIPVDPGFDPTTIPESTMAILDDVHIVFGQFSAWRLVQMTHNEPPWKDAIIESVITKKALKDYFSTQITHEH